MISSFIEQILDRISGADAIAAGLLPATALGCTAIAYWRTVEERSLSEFFEFRLPHAVVAHPSARADPLFHGTRKAIMPFLLIPAGVTFVVTVGYATNRAVGTLFGIDAPLTGGSPGPITVIVFTVTMLLAYDISDYLYHTAQHRFPFLWEPHEVHRSAEVMNRAWDGVIPGICFGSWTLIAFDPVEVTVFGVNVYVMRNILMMDFVRHTHFRISFDRHNNLILYPHWHHQLHHSTDPRHDDKNFGLPFPFRDRVFGTLRVPEPNESFTFGLVDRDVRDDQSLNGLDVLPLKTMWRVAERRVRPRPAARVRPWEGSRP